MRGSRRKFLRRALAAAAGLSLTGCARFLGLEEPAPETPPSADPGRSPAEPDGRPEVPRPGRMPTRPLGETGFQVGLFGLGGEATVEQAGRNREASAIINRALDLGVNYIDTAPTYGGGGSETNIGQVMKDRRREAFLATKTRDRSYDGTMRLFEQSLNRLQTDYLDLYQLHNVRQHEELDRALAPDGAVRAMEELREQGVIGHIGITGHRDPEVLRRALERYPFDCLLMTLNAADRHYRPFQEDLLKKAVEQKVGVIAMKVTAQGRLFSSGALPSMAEALGYVLTLPVSTAIVGISTLEELEINARLAREFRPLSQREMEAVEEMTRPHGDEGNFFKIHW